MPIYIKQYDTDRAGCCQDVFFIFFAVNLLRSGEKAVQKKRLKIVDYPAKSGFRPIKKGLRPIKARSLPQTML